MPIHHHQRACRETKAHPSEDMLANSQLSKLMHRDFRSDDMRVVRWPGQATLRVTETNQQRAFRILDALCRWLADSGYRVSIVDHRRDQRYHSLVVGKGDDGFRITLAERLRQSDHVPTAEERERIARWGPWAARKIDLKASGQFVLEFLHLDSSYTSYGRWKDGSKKLEQQLGEAAQRVPEIFARLVAEKQQRAEAPRAERLEAAERAKEEARKRQEAAVRAVRERFDAELKADLRHMVELWDDANRIREFVDVAEPLVLGGHARDDPNANARRAWIVWARAYADSLDPLRRPAEIAKKVTPSTSSGEL